MATQAEYIADVNIPHAGEPWETGVWSGDQRYGKPKFDRRLSDKILASFNHAYASGETELAEKLGALLEETERKELSHCERPGASVLNTPVRRSSSSVHQARLWRRFVDARQEYIALTIRKNSQAEHVKAAFEGMRTSYARWAVS